MFQQPQCILQYKQYITISKHIWPFASVTWQNTLMHHGVWTLKGLISKPHGWTIVIQIITLTFITMLNLMTNISLFFQPHLWASSLSCSTSSSLSSCMSSCISTICHLTKIYWWQMNSGTIWDATIIDFDGYSLRKKQFHNYYV